MLPLAAFKLRTEELRSLVETLRTQSLKCEPSGPFQKAFGDSYVLSTITSILTIACGDSTTVISTLHTRKQELRDVPYIAQAHGPQRWNQGLTVISPQPQGSHLPPLLIGPLGFKVRGGNHPEYTWSAPWPLGPQFF